MALQFIFGNPGSGKSDYLYRQMIEQSMRHPDKNYIVLVPEQFTMQTQRELVRLHPRHGIMNIDVLSFGRLAHRVFEELGANDRTVLDDIGKSMLLRKAAGDVESELKVLKQNIRRLGYISEVKSVISEFTQYDVGADAIGQVMESEDTNPRLYWKLHDIRVIQQKFCEYMQGKYITGEEILDVLSEVAGQSLILRESVLALDGFTGFTPVQDKLLGRLLAVCGKVFVTVTIDQRENPYLLRHRYQLFALSKQMVTGLMEIAKAQRIEVEEPVCLYGDTVFRFRDNEALGFLEKNLFRFTKNRYEKGQSAVSLHSARNPKAESAFIAGEIRRLVREEGYRYRDMAVIVSDMGTYAEYMEKAFSTLGIPLFMDYKRSVLLNSFVEYVRSLLAMAAEHFSYESTFRFLRTDLTGFPREEIDDVENYVIALGIRGYGQWSRMWVRRFGAVDAEKLERYNAFRQAFVDKLEGLTAVLGKRKKTVREVTEALYAFFVQEQLQRKVKAYELRFQSEGEFVLAKEYAQIYRIVMELFDKFVELLGDEQISLKEYSELLDAGLQEAKVGVIPPGLDQVVAGDIERTRLQDVKVLFLAGCSDTWIPGRPDGGGLLTERDREVFDKSGTTLAPCAKEQAYIQKFYLYLNMTKPSDRLYLSFAKITSDGKGLRPSYLIQDMKRLYPGLSVVDEDGRAMREMELTPDTAIDCLLAGLKRSGGVCESEWRELYTWYRKNEAWSGRIRQLLAASRYERPHDNLTEKLAGELYGRILENSVTRLEKFSACAYAHFLSYGMKLQERAVYEFQPVDLGNIFHSAMEYFSKELEKRGFTWTTIPEEERESLIEESVEKGTADYGNAVLHSSERNAYIVTRLKRLLRRTVWALGKQLACGDFIPAGYEISFGNLEHLESVNLKLAGEGRMHLRGKIDRVDICEDDEKLYVKVIDYKTGAKVFELGELYHGLQLQLVVYMNAALEMEGQKHPDKQVIPAGIFYYRMQDPLVDKASDEEALERSILKELKPDGLVSASEEVIRHLDREFTGSSLVIPVERKQDQSLGRRSKAVHADAFQVMSRYTDKLMNQIGRRILAGEAEAVPYEYGTRTGCDYCPYRGICGFDRKLPGYEYRRLPKLTDEQVLNKMREETMEHGSELDEGAGAGNPS